MKYITSLALACCLFAGVSFAQDAVPCCGIVSINTTKGIITSRNNTSGKLQQFKISATSLKNLRIGDKLSVQNGKLTGVNENRFEPVNEIVSGQVNDGAPCCEIVSLQVNDADPCCEIVTVKNLTSGELSSFQTIAGIGRTLTLGQSVNLQNGYALVQSGASASALQKGLYAFKVGMDSFAVQQNAVEEKDSEKWVITRSGSKGATGNVTIALPAGTNWYLYFQTTAGKDLVRLDNIKSHSLIPGNYNITVSSVAVLEVPVQKGMNTRLKAGTLYVSSTGNWMLYDETQKTGYVSYNSPRKIGLPIGKYAIYINGQYQQVEIKDGEVTEF